MGVNFNKLHQFRVQAREMIEMNVRISGVMLVFGVIPLLSWRYYKDRMMTPEERVLMKIERAEKRRKETWDE